MKFNGQQTSGDFVHDDALLAGRGGAEGERQPDGTLKLLSATNSALSM